MLLGFLRFLPFYLSFVHTRVCSVSPNTIRLRNQRPLQVQPKVGMSLKKWARRHWFLWFVGRRPFSRTECRPFTLCVLCDRCVRGLDRFSLFSSCRFQFRPRCAPRAAEF